MKGEREKEVYRDRAREGERRGGHFSPMELV